MYKITYHLKDLYLRNVTNLTHFADDLQDVTDKFPMIELIELTPKYYTILINTNDPKKKNRIVRLFGHKLAVSSFLLGMNVQHNANSSTLFVAKKVVEV